MIERPYTTIISLVLQSMSKSLCMKELSSVLALATNQIDSQYFHLEVDGGDPVYRERVYCYELYHQMRLRWPVKTVYYLNGEIDKAAHPILRKLKADHIKPDLLVHKPGFMSGNHAIIEVKHQRATLAGIQKDLESLSLFKNTVRYERAIYLIYGADIDPEKFTAKVQKVADKVEGLAEIELWYHLSHFSEAFHYTTLKRD